MKYFASIKIILISAIVLFGAMSFVWAQGFTEPGDDPSLPAPIATSNAGQAMNSALGVGVSSESQIPDDVSLFVLGTTATTDGPYATHKVGVVDTSNGSTPFRIDGSQAEIGDACPNNARVCVMESSIAYPSVSVVQTTGIGAFGETQASGKAGVHGNGYYGVYARATGNKQATALVGQSCTENSGVCIAPFGTAGFFDGDTIIEKALGTVTGDGRNLYRVASLYNKEEDYYFNGNPGATPEADRSDGLAYKTFGVFEEIEIASSDTETIASVVNVAAGEKVMSVVVVEGDGSTWTPAKNVDVTYDESGNTISMTNISAAPLFVQLIVSYLK